MALRGTSTLFERVQLRDANPSSPYLDLNRQVVTPLSSMSAAESSAAQRQRQLIVSSNSSVPFWGNQPGPFDVVRFGKNLAMPGICQVRGIGFEQRLQRDKPAGTRGHSVKHLGMEPCKIDITLLMWTEEHLRAFEKLVPMLLAEKTKDVVTISRVTIGSTSGAAPSTILGSFYSPAPLLEPSGTRFFPAPQSRVVTTTQHNVPAGPAAIDVYHPWLALFRIRTVHIVSISIPEPQQNGDVWESKVVCEQFLNQKSAVTPTTKSVETLRFDERGQLGETAATRELRKAATKPSTRAKAVTPNEEW